MSIISRLLLIPILSIQLYAQDGTRTKNPDTVFLGINFAGNRLPSKFEFEDKFGKACPMSTNSASYYLQNSTTIVSIYFDNYKPQKCVFGIKLSLQDKIPVASCVSKRITELSTGKGIRLGDSVKKVRETYGSPAYANKKKDGSEILVYSDLILDKFEDQMISPYTAMQITVKKSKVIEIYIQRNGGYENDCKTKNIKQVE